MTKKQLSAENFDLLMKFNRTSAEFPSEKCLPELFEEQCKQTPDAIAVKFYDKTLTYSELNRKANQVAHYLRKNGIDTDNMVGLCAERSFELVIGVLGILKAGAAYVPFDASYPAERIEHMLSDSKIKIVLVQDALSGIFQNKSLQILSLDKEWQKISQENSENPSHINKPLNLAYVLFTSGSTGKPKGVGMIHRALMNLIHWQKTKTNLGVAAKTLQFAPISFDVSFQELFTTWTTGGTLVLIEDDFRLNAIKLLEFINTEKIERLFLPFIALQHLAEVADENKIFPNSLKDVITAGEQLQITKHIANFFAALPSCKLHNHYGPTESHVCTAYTLQGTPDKWNSLPPIGTPISNTQIYLLDEKLNPVKVGEEGELFIGGIALARGYVNRADLTAERFIENPFGIERIYKTGDLAKYLPDGNIEYLGRIDGQVKVRGYRIELGEIEIALGKNANVNQCVVIAREDEPGDKRLVAYIIPNEKNNFHQNDLRKFLKDKLPDYMMPSAFMQMDVFPRTPSGKIDKRSLPQPELKRPELDTIFVEAQTDLEKIVGKIWGKLLRIDKIGINDNFFDLGGNSLLALQMIAKLKTENGIDLPVVKLYQHPTISAIVKMFSNENKEQSFYEKAKSRIAKEKKSNEVISSVEDGIAIIGMAGRFPGAKNTEELWKNLIEGIETTKFFSKEELDGSIPSHIKNDSSYVSARGVIDDADKFDAAFFGVSPKIAELMDPQQRIFLEVAWESLENAGYSSENFKGMIGVFAGMGNNTYFTNNVISRKELIERVGSFSVMTANEKDYIATRISHEMNLTGPALSIHTACSTSLVAVTVAFENLINNKCDMAIAGGISITSPINSGHIYNEGGMFSSDGHTRTFDASATGTVFSDGCGIVVLKRYKDAVRDGDEIYAVLRGAALNNDGSDKASFTAPSVEGQAMVVAMAQANAGVEPDTITFIETHGTATPLGDPIEIEALTQAFRGKTHAKQFCAVGSIKSNFGHLTPAAGVTGLIKTTLALKHKKIPATLHFEKPNPAIDFASSPFYVNNKLIDWNTNGIPRRAGVSSFGVGGTNVHVIVEEAPQQSTSGDARAKHLLLLSAKTPTALDAATKNLTNYLKTYPEINLADVAFTLQTGRKSFNHRRFIVCDNHEIENLIPKNSASRILESGSPEIVFMFPGQGSQYVNMGQNLYRDEIIFKQAVDHCAEFLEKNIGKDIRTILYPPQGKESDSEKLLKETVYTQSSLFTIGYALSKLWESWGITPKAMIGHSIGEYAAACISGVMSLEDACFLVAHRGKMMQELSTGSMLTVRMPVAEVEPYLNKKLSIAAINGPQLCVVSGETAEIENLQKELEKKDIVCKLLVTSHAFHSPMMEPILKPFEEKVKSIKLNEPKIPFISTVTTKWITKEEATNPEYWSQQIRKPVRFAEGIQTLWNEKPSYVLLELGPRTTAATLAKQQATDLKKQIAISTLSDTAENNAEWSAILFAAGQLWLSGAKINWENFYALEKRKRVPLPTYAFDKKRYWVEAINLESGVRGSEIKEAPGFQFPISNHQLPIEQNTQHEIQNTSMNNRKDRIVSELKEMFEESSGIELKNVGDDVSFLEMGLDSLFLTQSALSVSKKYGIKVTFRQLNEEFSTLGTLSAHLDKNLPAEAAPTSAPSPSPSIIQNTPRPAPVAVTGEGMNPMQMMMMQQMQMMQMMMQQMNQPPHQQIAPSVQAHIEKSVEIKAHTKKEDISENEKAELAKPFGAIARIEKSTSGDFTDAQKKWFSDFTVNYNKKTQKSKTYCQDNRAHLADPRVVTGFKPLLKEIIYQVVIDKSKGVDLWDLDGNKYVDVLNGFGSNFFGWNSDILMNVWKKQMEEGMELGPQTPLAGECAKLICELTGYDRAGFCNTGSEAVLGAMRIARTVTGKNTIVCFNGSYHGINDEVIVRGTKKLKSFPAAAGIPAESVQNMLVLDYGTEESLQIIRERIDEIAAVMIEPIQSRRADFQPKEFIHEVRKITKESGALMILDEVITGFRLRLGGAQEFYDVKADLSTYGKVIGGNMPVGAIAGRREFMDALDGGHWQFGDFSVPEVGVTYFAGTFVRHPLMMAAMKEVLTHLKREGKPLYEKLNGKTQRLVDEVNAHSKKINSPFKLVTFGSLFKAKWEVEPAYTELLFALMRYKGVHIMDGFPCFLTLAYTDADVDFVIKTYKESLSELVELGFIPTSTNLQGLSTSSTGNGAPQNMPPVPGAKLGKDANGKPGWFVPDPEKPGKYLQVKV